MEEKVISGSIVKVDYGWPGKRDDAVEAYVHVWLDDPEAAFELPVETLVDITVTGDLGEADDDADLD